MLFLGLNPFNLEHHWAIAIGATGNSSPLLVHPGSQVPSRDDYTDVLHNAGPSGSAEPFRRETPTFGDEFLSLLKVLAGEDPTIFVLLPNVLIDQVLVHHFL
jgi:hypothetical protein